MYFSTKSYLKNTRNHTAKHTLTQIETQSKSGQRFQNQLSNVCLRGMQHFKQWKIMSFHSNYGLKRYLNIYVHSSNKSLLCE